MGQGMSSGLGLGPERGPLPPPGPRSWAASCAQV